MSEGRLSTIPTEVAGFPISSKKGVLAEFFLILHLGNSTQIFDPSHYCLCKISIFKLS